LAPEAINVTDCPLQILGAEGVIITVGSGLTVTVTSFWPVQVPFDPDTVYFVVTVGFAATVEPVDGFSPTVGVQE
jgi:hypothetical protein